MLLLLAFISGAVLPIQAGLNAKMGKAVGDPVYAALISFVVGSIGLFIYALITNTDLSQISNASSVNFKTMTALMTTLTPLFQTQKQKSVFSVFMNWTTTSLNCKCPMCPCTKWCT